MKKEILKQTKLQQQQQQQSNDENPFKPKDDKFPAQLVSVEFGPVGMFGGTIKEASYTTLNGDKFNFNPEKNNKMTAGLDVAVNLINIPLNKAKTSALGSEINIGFTDMSRSAITPRNYGDGSGEILLKATDIYLKAGPSIRFTDGQGFFNQTSLLATTNLHQNTLNFSDGNFVNNNINLKTTFGYSSKNGTQYSITGEVGLLNNTRTKTTTGLADGDYLLTSTDNPSSLKARVAFPVGKDGHSIAFEAGILKPFANGSVIEPEGGVSVYDTKKLALEVGVKFRGAFDGLFNR
jgi:hypothetical protein